MSTVAASFWDADETEAPPVREMTVGPASVGDCAEFARRYHYSGHASNQMWRYGLWHGPTLWGVIGYNTPTRKAQESVFGAEHADHVAHMSRLAVAEHARPNSESRLISGSLRLLASDVPRIWAILSYADILQDHIGYVYQATNAIYTGIGAKVDRYVTADGQIKGNYSHGRIYPRDAIARGWTVVPPKGKHRYVYILGSAKQRRLRRLLLKLDELPYPKQANGAARGETRRP